MTVETQGASRLRFDNIRLATEVRLQYAAQGEPSALPIVFLHGYTDSWFSFSRLLPSLSGDRFRAYVLDQRGHGESDKPEAGYSMDDFAADVVAFLDSVGVERAALVGHSMSSIIVRRVAELYPDRVSHLVLLGTAATPVNASVLELHQLVSSLRDPVPEAFARDFQVSTQRAPLPPAFLDRVVAESLKLPARVWHAALDGIVAANDSAQLEHIKAPTFVIIGELDPFFPLAEQQQLAATIPGARHKVYAGTGHNPHWEQPEQVAADLKSFVGG